MIRKLFLLAVLAGLGIAALIFSSGGDAASQNNNGRRATAVFAGGCFWCTESDFDKMPGVISTTSGYTGGKLLNPTYEQVSAGNTGHIEAVQVVYDSARITYQQLVDRFFRTIDPTDAGGSFCDRGYQYRTAIFVGDRVEQRIALTTRQRVGQSLRQEVATLVLPAAPFYPAEAYHQDYYKKNPIRYRFYRTSCGRDARLSQLWAGVK